MTRGRKVTVEEEKKKEKMVEDDKQQLEIELALEPVQPFCELIEEEEEKKDEQMRETPIILSEKEKKKKKSLSYAWNGSPHKFNLHVDSLIVKKKAKFNKRVSSPQPKFQEIDAKNWKGRKKVHTWRLQKKNSKNNKHMPQIIKHVQ